MRMKTWPIFGGNAKQNSTPTSGRKPPSTRTWKRCTQRTETCCWFKKMTNSLEWAKNNRNNEVAAIAAAKEMRSRVESRRKRDDGRKASAGKAVQDLGGYFCDDRLQVWTDGSCLDPRWEAVARAGAGAECALPNQGTDRTDVSQRRVRASGMHYFGCGRANARIHTDCGGERYPRCDGEKERHQQRESTQRFGR